MRLQTLLLSLLLLATSTLSYPHLSLRSLTLPTLIPRQCNGKIACFFKAEAATTKFTGLNFTDIDNSQLKAPDIIPDDASRAAGTAQMMAAGKEGQEAAKTACNPYLGKC